MDEGSTNEKRKKKKRRADDVTYSIEPPFKEVEDLLPAYSAEQLKKLIDRAMKEYNLKRAKELEDAASLRKPGSLIHFEPIRHGTYFMFGFINGSKRKAEQEEKTPETNYLVYTELLDEYDPTKYAEHRLLRVLRQVYSERAIVSLSMQTFVEEKAKNYAVRSKINEMEEASEEAGRGCHAEEINVYAIAADVRRFDRVHYLLRDHQRMIDESKSNFWAPDRGPDYSFTQLPSRENLRYYGLLNPAET